MKSLLCLLLLLPNLALAAVVHLNWMDPTLWSDGTALPGTAITQTVIEYGTCAGGTLGTVVGQVVASGGLQHADTPDLVPGVWCFLAITTAGNQAGTPSNLATITIAAPKPSPSSPTNLTATQ